MRLIILLLCFLPFLVEAQTFTDTVSVEEMKSRFMDYYHKRIKDSVEQLDLFGKESRIVYSIELRNLGYGHLPASKWDILHKKSNDGNINSILYWTGFLPIPTTVDTTAMRKELKSMYGVVR